MFIRYFIASSLFILSFFLAADLKAQDEETDSTFRSKVGIHLNLNFYDTDNVYSTYHSTQGVTTVYTNRTLELSFSPAVRVSTKNGNSSTYAFEDLVFEIRKNGTYLVYDTILDTLTISGQKLTSIALTPRYEFDFIFFKSKKSRFKPYLGVAVSPFFKYTKNVPEVSNLFDTHSWSLGIQARLVPGILYTSSSDAYMSFSFPMAPGIFAIKQHKTDNPALPEKTRRTTTFDSDFGFSVYARFAYGIYIR